MSKAFPRHKPALAAIARLQDGDTSIEHLTSGVKYGNDQSVFDRLVEKNNKAAAARKHNKAERESRLALRKF